MSKPSLSKTRRSSPDSDLDEGDIEIQTKKVQSVLGSGKGVIKKTAD
jgi:hypothetical protein